MSPIKIKAIIIVATLFQFTASAQWRIEDFRSPDNEYRSQTWYHWQNGHISKEAIKADLESMKDVGLGGFYLFTSAEGIPSGPIKYMTEEWFDAYHYAGNEAKRLGLEMGVVNGSGWSVSGGPWVKPEDSMQEVAWTETILKGPSHFDGNLAEPIPCLGFERDMQKDPVKNRRYYVPRDQLVGHYHDIVILAFPTPEGEENGRPYHINGWWGKAGYSKMSFWNIDETETPIGDVIDLDDIINLSGYVGEDGRLIWDVPEGTWTVLRIGYQPTGTSNHPAAEGGSGLEVDKLSSSALDKYWSASTERLLKGSEEVRRILIDSYEAGLQNWTAGFEKEFMRRMGYDPKPYLPTIAGRVIESTRVTEQFLWDYRKVISDLLNENFYDHFATLSHQHGVQLAIEPYGQFGNTDEFSTGENADILAGEFWAGENGGSTNRTTMKLASSLSNIYGKEIVGAEAFTNSGKVFEIYPGMLKTQGDYYYCLGMNQIWLHSYVLDPYERIPGMTLGSYGTHFNRRNTWWNYSRPWFDYQARCQYMLRQGESIRDILYYMGEDAPVRPPKSETLNPAIPIGYDFDFCGGSDILQSLKAGKGTVTTPSGKVYKLLVVKSQKYLRLSVLKDLLSLVSKGAIVYLEAPMGSPSLGDEEKELRELVSKVWKNSSRNIINHGQGKIYSNALLKDILNANRVIPDLEVTLPENYKTENTVYPEGPVVFTHKKSENTDIYFISNQQVNTSIEPTLTFSVKRKTPEIWDPKDGSSRPVDNYWMTSDGRIQMRLPLEESGSVFVVFKKPYIKPSRTQLREEKADKKSISLSENWSIALAPGFSGPGKSLSINTLSDLSQSQDPDVKYHSGEIVYNNSFNLNDLEGNRFILDLGKVAILAKIKINGQDVGTTWCEPHRIDLSEYVKEGENTLEITVVNLLFNRLAGDLLLPEDCEWTTETGSTAEGYSLFRIPQWVIDGKDSPTGRKTFATWKWPYMKDKSIPPSGLIGPVTITATPI